MTAARWAMEKNEPAGNGTGTLPNSPFQFRPLGASAGVAGGGRLPAGRQDARCRRGAGAGRHPRPDGDRHRPRAALQGKPGTGGEARRRAVPLGAALIDLARSEDAAGDHHRRGLQPARARRQDDARKPRRPACLDRGGERPTGAFRREPARHDQDRGRHGRCRSATGSMSPTSSTARLQRAAQIFPGPNDRDEHRRRPAADPRRQRASGAGAVQSDRQRGQVWRAATRSASMPATRRRTKSSFRSPISARAFPRRIWRTSSKNSSGAANRTAELPGPGLGLAIAKGFVEAMGGTIKAESPAVQRRGTRITLRFPAAPTSAKLPESR